MIKRCILIVCVFMRLSSAVVINCDFVLQPLKAVDGSATATNLYTCITKNLAVDLSDRYITDLIGSHLPGFSNAKIDQLIIDQQIVKVLPRGLSKFIPNLKIAIVTSSKLTGVEPEDLLGLVQLEQLFLGNNEIEILLPNIFRDNLKLTAISLRQNKLRSIAGDLFVNLPQLSNLFLDDNACISSRATNIKELSFLKSSLATTCKLPQFIESTLSSLTQQTFTCNADVNQIKNALTSCLAGLPIVGGLPNLGGLTPDVKKSGVCNFILNGNDYICNLVLKIMTPDVQVVKLDGAHEYQKTNIDLTSIVASAQVIRFIPPRMFVDVPNVRLVSISGSQLLAITAKTFSALPKLEELKLPNNGLSIIDNQIFAQNPLLKNIDLTGNKIHTISKCAFANLKKLQVLSLSGNLLSQLPLGLFKDTLNLRSLLLNDNKLALISPLVFEPLKQIQVINLINNVCVNELVQGVQQDFLKPLLKNIGGIFRGITNLLPSVLPGITGITDTLPNILGVNALPTLSGVTNDLPGLSGVTNTLPGLSGVTNTLPDLSSITNELPGLSGVTNTLPNLSGITSALPSTSSLFCDLPFNFIGGRQLNDIIGNVLSATINNLGYIVIKGADTNVKVLHEKKDDLGNILKLIKDSAGNVIELKTSIEGRIISSIVKSSPELPILSRTSRQLGGLDLFGSLGGLGSLEPNSVQSTVRALPLSQLPALKQLSGLTGLLLPDSIIPSGIIPDSLTVSLPSVINLGNALKGTITKTGQIVVGAIDKNGNLVPEAIGSISDDLNNALGHLTATIDGSGNILISVANGSTGIQMPIPQNVLGTKLGLNVDVSGKLLGLVLNQIPAIKDTLAQKCGK